MVLHVIDISLDRNMCLGVNLAGEEAILMRLGLFLD